MNVDYGVSWKIKNTKPKNEIEKRIYDNIFLVTNMLSKKKPPADIDNVFMDGVEALIEAAYKYDESKSAKFSTYAYTAIQRRLACSLIEDGRCVSLPRYAKEGLLKIYHILYNNPNLTIDDINLRDHKIRGIKKEETLQSLKDIYNGMFNFLSIYERNDKDEERENPEAQNPVDEIDVMDNKIMCDKIKKIISRLPDRQREVMMRRYFDVNKDYMPRIAEVAKDMGLYRQTAFKAEQKAISRLQRIYKEK